MMMILLAFVMLVGPTACGVIDIIDVCKCATQEGSFVCVLQRGAQLTASECDGTSLRTTGPGFVTGMRRDVLSKFEVIVVERSTLSCDNMATATTNVTRLIVDGAVCVAPTTTTTTTNTTTTTTTKKMMPTKETKPRPPAHPVPNDNDDDDDDDNDDDYDDDDSGTSTSTSTNTDSSTTTATTTTLTTRRMITISAASVTLRDGILLGVGILIAGAGVIVIVRVTILRRRRSAHYPVQVNEVTSTDDQPQRTYVLRQVPRSPRRRGTDSMESVTLFAVDDHEL